MQPNVFLKYFIAKKHKGLNHITSVWSLISLEIVGEDGTHGASRNAHNYYFNSLITSNDARCRNPQLQEFLTVNSNPKSNPYRAGEGGGWFTLVVLFCLRRKESCNYLAGVEIKWLMHIALWEWSLVLIDKVILVKFKDNWL